MKKIKFSLTKGFNAVLVALLGLLGFSNTFISCLYGVEIPVEYGTPTADYVVKGKITNKADKKPIKDIRVGFSSLPLNSGKYEIPYVQTDENGNYILKGDDYSHHFGYLDSLFVYDIDGVENGGEFIGDTIAIDWKNAQKTKQSDGHWYKGEYTVNQNVELKEK